MARKVKDPLALGVRHALSDILKRVGPYSSARISNGTIHRTSWPIRPRGLEFKRYPSDDDISLREYKLINKYVAGIREKLARAIACQGRDGSPNGFDMSRITVGWHFGAGLYLNVRVGLVND